MRKRTVLCVSPITLCQQFEGAYYEDGKGMSIWDVQANNPGLLPEGDRIHDNHTGNVANDFYHRYKEDILLAKELGATQFRFSISWARIFPNGDGSINQVGLKHYVDMVDFILSIGMEPVVTLYHWDLPQALQERIGGWNSEQVAPVFAAYAATMFEALGDKVTYWSTINEPKTFCWEGYGNGGHAPNIHSHEQAANCTINVLRAHAAAVKEFRKLVPGGFVSMNINVETSLPYDSTSELDTAAAQRKMDFEVGVYMDPIFFGQFPDSVRARLPYLPDITPKLADALKGSMDYIAMNHYTSSYALCIEHVSDYDVPDNHVNKNGFVIGKQGDSGWLYSFPLGFRMALNYMNDRYKTDFISVTENGFMVKGEDDMTMDEILNDKARIEYFEEYIKNAIAAVVPIRSYFAWALMDNFEWKDGYSKHFGVMYWDRFTQVRIKKASARWMQNKFLDAPGN
ncbi:glycoside hydrolase [Coccomyxa subellipsoidea C-169]|uniref:Glycoside hydrolase n=1 Tax=Coccomyxa subellipsoidea (strain C-169) TaxID=574566 RepID=I0Z102_COCSC|nr:glycoside hydrolase [Coccomyxa subellipsoidea C-169]EIE24321.1 glycoside hydrolase [Coccomyxa subellipsoidea C-169]|eukprot:XP_005648865.1 glycoside hydrolase [Coccomyxa subellipsoidea C-169]